MIARNKSLAPILEDDYDIRIKMYVQYGMVIPYMVTLIKYKGLFSFFGEDLSQFYIHWRMMQLMKHLRKYNKPLKLN